MALNTAALVAAADGFKAAFPYLSIHTDTAIGSSGAESAAARVAAAWVNTNGNLTSTGKAFSGGAASGPAKRVGYWSAATGGTFGGSSLLTGDQAFNAAGNYTVSSVAENASAS